MPNFLRSVGCSYSTTNRTTAASTAHAHAIAATLARPKITHSPAQPAKKPRYIGFRTYRYGPTTTSLCGGAMGAGVPCPVLPKSQIHLTATAKPSTEGTAAIHRHRAAPAVSTSKPSYGGNSQNHSARNDAPTTNDAMVVPQCTPSFGSLRIAVCPLVIGASTSTRKYAPT